jgi:hypothetical protein
MEAASARPIHTDEASQTFCMHTFSHSTCLGGLLSKS